MSEEHEKAEKTAAMTGGLGGLSSAAISPPQLPLSAAWRPWGISQARPPLHRHRDAHKPICSVARSRPAKRPFASTSPSTPMGLF